LRAPQRGCYALAVCSRWTALTRSSH
jgi:hypothetical protein